MLFRFSSLTQYIALIRPTTGSAKRLVTSLQYKDGASLLKTVDGDIYACAMDDEEKFLYFRDHKGRFGRMEIANPDNVEILNENCGTVDKNTFLFSLESR